MEDCRHRRCADHPTHEGRHPHHHGEPCEIERAHPCQPGEEEQGGHAQGDRNHAHTVARHTANTVGRHPPSPPNRRLQDYDDQDFYHRQSVRRQIGAPDPQEQEEATQDDQGREVADSAPVDDSSRAIQHHDPYPASDPADQYDGEGNQTFLPPSPIGQLGPWFQIHGWSASRGLSCVPATTACQRSSPYRSTTPSSSTTRSRWKPGEE